jgi:hypothetical protein
VVAYLQTEYLKYRYNSPEMEKTKTLCIIALHCMKYLLVFLQMNEHSAIPYPMNRILRIFRMMSCAGAKYYELVFNLPDITTNQSIQKDFI